MDQSSPTVQFSRLLVADDSETIQKVVRIALGRQPVKVEVASSWPEASAKLQEGVALLLLDPNLPGVDASEEKIRDVVRAAGKTPVLVMIGSHEKSVSDEALKECGIAETIHKPFDSSELVSLVMRLVESAGGSIGEVNRAVDQSVDKSATPVLPDSSFGTETVTVSGSGFTPPPPPPDLRALGGLDGPIMGGAPVGGREANLTPPPPSSSLAPPPPPHVGDDVNLELPPLPSDLVDASRKGKKAFDLDPDKLFELDSLEPTQSGDVTEFTLSPDDIPPQLTNSLVEGFANSATANSVPGESSRGPVASGSAAEASQLNQEVLAREIRKAVEEYCAKHFRSLAIEVITAELRRLAEEKARHLVDI